MKGSVRILTLLLCLAVLTPALCAAQEAQTSAVVKSAGEGETVDLFAVADDASGADATYYNGTPVTILEQGEQWTQIQIGSAQGFMRTDEISADPAVSVRSETPLLWLRNLGADEKIPLYDKPSDTSSVLGQFRSVALEMLGKVTDPTSHDIWYHVRVRGKIGYMRAEYLSVIPIADATSSASVVQAVTSTPEAGQMLSLMEGLQPGGENGYPKGYYFSGIPVEVIDEISFPAATWALVRLDWFTVGFMNKAFLAQGDNASDDVHCNALTILLCEDMEDERVRLYARPSQSAPTLGKYADGTEATMMGLYSAGEWVHVEIDGLRGYVRLVNIAQIQQ